MDHKINQYLKREQSLYFAPLHMKLDQAEFIGAGIVLGHVGRWRRRCHMTKKKKKNLLIKVYFYSVEIRMLYTSGLNIISWAK